jgi:succinate dehydrogenase hydrophobic membrane anchor protein
MVEDMSVRLWRWQRWSAVVLLPLLVFHIVLQVYVIGTENIDFSGVAERLGVWIYFAVDAVLLVAVVTHAFIGVRSVLLDYFARDPLTRRLTFVVIGFAIGLVFYGVATLSAFSQVQ